MNWELGVKVPSGEDCILSNVQWINKKELLSHEIYKSNLQPLLSHYNHNPSYQEGISVAVKCPKISKNAMAPNSSLNGSFDRFWAELYQKNYKLTLNSIFLYNFKVWNSVLWNIIIIKRVFCVSLRY